MASSSLRQRNKVTSNGDPSQKAAAEGLRGSSQRLISWHELPEWMKDNEYIVSGYRREMNSVLECMHSIFAYVHNETVNIHSHLWGALLFVFFLSTFSTYLVAYPSASNGDFAFFTLFLMGGIACMSFSTLSHTLASHSKTMAAFFYSMDYIGIIVFIVTSNMSGIYYLFYCDLHLRILYHALLITAGISSAYIILSPKYSSPEYRSARVLVFSALGLTGVIPTVHAFHLFGFHSVWSERGYGWVITGAVFYIAGALIYANRFPERWWPGRFDHWGASHQILHFHVVVAALMHYMSIRTGAEHWHGVMQGTCSVIVS